MQQKLVNLEWLQINNKLQICHWKLTTNYKFGFSTNLCLFNSLFISHQEIRCLEKWILTISPFSHLKSINPSSCHTRKCVCKPLHFIKGCMGISHWSSSHSAIPTNQWLFIPFHDTWKNMFAFASHGEMRNLPLAILLTMFSFSHLNQSIFLHVTWENLFASSFHGEMRRESPLAFYHLIISFCIWPFTSQTFVPGANDIWVHTWNHNIFS
jgi:hypothetical protein